MDQLSEKTAKKVAASRPMDQLSENLDENCRFAAPMDQLSERPVKCESTVRPHQPGCTGLLWCGNNDLHLHPAAARLARRLVQPGPLARDRAHAGVFSLP